MRYFWTALRLSLHGQVRNVRVWALFLLLPVLVWAAAACMPPEESAAPVQVGVYLPQGQGEMLRQLLEARSGTVLTFIFTDEDTMKGKVAAGMWDCALALDQDFEEKLASLDTDRLFTLYIGEGSAVWPLVQEAVAACVGELTAGGIALEYMEQVGMTDLLPPEAVEERIVQVLPQSQRVQVGLVTAHGGELDPLVLARDGTDGVLTALCAVVLTVWFLFSAMDLGRWLESPAAMRMRALRGAWALLLPRAVGAAVPALVSGVLTMLLLGRGAVWFALLIAAAAVLCAVSAVCARLRTVWQALPVVMPFVPVMAALMWLG